MIGILDGLNLEDRSVPLLKLEEDVVTQIAFNGYSNSTAVILTDLTARVNALENTLNNNGIVRYVEEIDAPGAGSYVTINPNPVVTNGYMILTIKREGNLDPAFHQFNLGEVYYMKISDSEYRVYSSGSPGAAKIICAIVNNP